MNNVLLEPVFVLALQGAVPPPFRPPFDVCSTHKPPMLQDHHEQIELGP